MKLFSHKNFLIKLNPKLSLGILFFIFFYTNLFSNFGFKIPNKPYFIYPVQDYANVFNTNEKIILNKHLINYAQQTSTEILIVTVETLNQDDPNFIASTWAEKWKIGQKGKNNGIIFLISIKEKKIAIQVGRSLEDLLTDSLVKRIIENYFKPYAKQENFYKATNSSIEVIKKVLLGRYVYGISKKENQVEISYEIIILFIIILLILIIQSKKNKEINSNTSSQRKKDILINQKKKKYLGTDIIEYNDFPLSGHSNDNTSDGFGGLGSGGSFGGGGSSGNW